MEKPNDFIEKDTHENTDSQYQRERTEQYRPPEEPMRESYVPPEDSVHEPYQPYTPPQKESPDRSWPSRGSLGWLIALLLIVAAITVYILTRPRPSEDPQALSTATPTAAAVQESTLKPVESAPPVHTVLPTAAPTPMPTPDAQTSPAAGAFTTPGTTAMASLPATNSADDTWLLLLVNPENPLPDNWEVRLAEVRHEQWVDERCYADLKRMLDDCRAANLEPLVCSSYRTNDRQEELFNNRLGRLKEGGLSEQEASVETMKAVAVPGTSEHQTGLAVDIVDINNQNLDATQENTPVQQWLKNNCHKYGFILRYPRDKTETTGVAWESWHYRYVGPVHAAAITERNVCLEEYLAGR